MAKNKIKEAAEVDRLAPDTLESIENFILEAGSDNLPAFGGRFEGGVHCQQIADEFAACIFAMLQTGQRVKAYLEIGVAAGGTTAIIHNYFHPETIVLIDDNLHPKAKLRPEILRGISVREFSGTSSDPAIIAAAKDCGPYDAILIDSAHDYASVKADVDAYLPMLADGGFLILHDSAVDSLGIKRVVGELKSSDDVKFVNEYISAGHQPCGVALFIKA